MNQRKARAAFKTIIKSSQRNAAKDLINGNEKEYIKKIHEQRTTNKSK